MDAKGWKVDGVVQLILAVGLIAVTVWSCKPADHAARPAGGLTVRLAAYHLARCAACRAAGYTAETIAEADGPTPCHADRYPDTNTERDDR